MCVYSRSFSCDSRVFIFKNQGNSRRQYRKEFTVTVLCEPSIYYILREMYGIWTYSLRDHLEVYL